MNLKEFEVLATEKNYEEHPYAVYAGQTELKHFIEYDSTDIDLKIHMAKVILCRNFSPAGGNCVLSDHNWYIEQFLKSFQVDHIRPWLTDTIKESMEMILLGMENSSREIIGSTFMFGALEFYAKYLLGWRPMEANFFDDDTHSLFRKITLSDAINKLKKGDSELASIMKYIDQQSVRRLKEVGIEEKRWITPRIADRLRIARNPMLHGEHHGFSHIGTYLCMLYILFYLCDEKKRTLINIQKDDSTYSCN